MRGAEVNTKGQIPGNKGQSEQPWTTCHAEFLGLPETAANVGAESFLTAAHQRVRRSEAAALDISIKLRTFRRNCLRFRAEYHTCSHGKVSCARKRRPLNARDCAFHFEGVRVRDILLCA